jgi:hypothetical protein
MTKNGALIEVRLAQLNVYVASPHYIIRILRQQSPGLLHSRRESRWPPDLCTGL